MILYINTISEGGELMVTNGFILPNGKEYEVGKMTHEDLANLLLKRNGWKLTQKSASDTLIVSHGALKIGNGILGVGKVMTVHVSTSITSQKIWEWIDYYRDLGYEIDII